MFSKENHMSRSIVVLGLALVAGILVPAAASARGPMGSGPRIAPQMRFEQANKLDQLRVTPKFEKTMSKFERRQSLGLRTDCVWTQKRHPNGAPIRICF
jgi:hypothetical protein